VIFHRIAASDRGFSPGLGGREDTGGQAKYEIDIGRCLLAVGFLVLLFVASFAAWAVNWTDGSATILHMAEVVFGGVAGLFFGERGAISSGHR